MADEVHSAGAADEAKGLADSFVGVLGLVDVIFGGLTLYWVRLSFPPTVDAFPATGHDFVDVALLACAAGIIGRIVSLLANLATTIGWALLEKRKSFTDVRSALATYFKTVDPGVMHDASTSTVLTDSVAQIAATFPSERARLERELTRAEFIYGVAILLCLYVWHFSNGRFGWTAWVGIAAVVVLLFTAFVQQRAYLEGVRAALGAARTARSQAPAAKAR